MEPTHVGCYWILKSLTWFTYIQTGFSEKVTRKVKIFFLTAVLEENPRKGCGKSRRFTAAREETEAKEARQGQACGFLPAGAMLSRADMVHLDKYRFPGKRD
jgi:hypothetical protein